MENTSRFPSVCHDVKKYIMPSKTISEHQKVWKVHHDNKSTS